MIQVIKVINLNDYDLTTIVEESLKEGYRFIQRLIDEYSSGVNRFNRTGEQLYVMLKHEHVIGVGGLNIDPYVDDSRVGRIRHIYIVPNHRGKGLGKRLVQLLVDESRASFKVLRLYTENRVAGLLYERIGFKRVEGHHKATHILDLKAINLR